MFRGVPIAYWAMDLNPDQLIAMGKIKPTSFTARVLEAVNRFILQAVGADRRARSVHGRPIASAGAWATQKMLIMPPWPHEDCMSRPPPQATNPFRVAAGLVGKTRDHVQREPQPRQPAADAARRGACAFKDDDRGPVPLRRRRDWGRRKSRRRSRDNGLTNAISLPYQPLEELRLLAVGGGRARRVAGREHGRHHPPVQDLRRDGGRPADPVPRAPAVPRQRPAGRARVGWHVSHGEVEATVRAIETIQRTPARRSSGWGRPRGGSCTRSMGQAILCGRFCDHLERVFHPRDAADDFAGRQDVTPREAAGRDPPPTKGTSHAPLICCALIAMLLAVVTGCEKTIKDVRTSPADTTTLASR